MTIFVSPITVAVSANEVTFETEDANKFLVEAYSVMPRMRSAALFANTVMGRSVSPRMRSGAELLLRIYKPIGLDIWPVTVKVRPYALEYSNEYKFVVDARGTMPRLRARTVLSIPYAIQGGGAFPRARTAINVFMPPYDVTGRSVMPGTRSYGLVGIPVAVEAGSDMPRARSKASVTLKDFVVKRVTATTTFIKT